MSVKAKMAETRLRYFGLGAFFAVVLAHSLRAESLEQRVVLLANSRQTESVALARYYAEQRQVPAANIIALPLPEEESIPWRQFLDQVWQPLQDELYRRGWIEGTASSLTDRLGRRRYAPTSHKISYLVLCRGVPLRIMEDPLLPTLREAPQIEAPLDRNEGAVDSELALLALGNHEVRGLVANPLFAQRGVLSLDAAQVIKVTRLDGPSWESARRLVANALAAERSGLIGRYYLDLQGPHAEGDKWLKAVGTQLDELGFPGDIEATPGTMAPTARFESPVFYFGWYADHLNGPMALEGFAFPAGAVAVHVHSFSAVSLREPGVGWCGPLVARGATATVGNVFEPFLGLTHRPTLLLRALSQGSNFGDAASYALPALSWQAVAIGDPLYRPFKVGLDEQLERIGQLTPALAALVRLRETNQLASSGQRPEAISAGREALRLAELSGAQSLEQEIKARLARLVAEPVEDHPTLGIR